MTNSIAHPRRRREHALAAILIAAFVLIFLGAPIASHGTSLYSPADVTQASSLTRVDTDHHVGNPILRDVALENEPWALFDRDEIAHGRLPLWNPYNGGGTPHFADVRKAALSPFKLPYYFLGLKNALLAEAFLKLFCLGFFTYLFLRELELVFLAAMTGAVAFMFAGYNVLLLGYAHPAATVALPLALYYVERACRRFERAPPWDSAHTEHASPLRAVGALPFFGLAAAILVAILAGEPTAAYFAALLVLVYVALRLASMWLQSRGDLAALRSIGALAGLFLLVSALAVGVAAIQVVPALELARESRAWELAREDRALGALAAPLSFATWPLFFFPNLLGNPSTYYHVLDSLPPPDFETANLVYSGGLVLFLAATSLLFVTRNRIHAFFALAVLVWAVYAYDLGGASSFFALIPTLDHAPIDRSQAIPEFALACCAAFAVHHFVHVRVPIRSMLFASTLFAGLLLFATFLFGAQHVAVETYARLEATPEREAIYQYSTPHLVRVSLAYLPGILALAAMLLAPQGRLRRVFTAVILVSVFLQTGWLFRNYNPTTEARFVFPRTESVDALAKTVGRGSLAVLGDDTLLPDSNIVYGIAMPASAGGMSIERYDLLYREVFGASDERRTIRRATLQGLELFGVDHVLGASDWLDVDAPFGERPENARAFFETGEILPDSEIVQTFTSTQDRLQAIRIFAGSLGHSGACTLRAVLEDARDGRAIAAHDFDCRALPADPALRTALAFEFDAVPDSRGRAFRLRVSSPDARAGTGVSLWCRSDWRHWLNLALWRATVPKTLVRSAPPIADHPDLAAWQLEQAQRPIDGGLVFEIASNRDRFRRERAIGDRTLYAIEGGASRFRLVIRAIAVDSDEQAFARVQASDFDPRLEVVLDRREVEAAPSVRDDPEASDVRVVDEQPARVRLKIERSKPGWLVIAQPWYPGWTARVDGEAREITRANFAFSAVRIGTGESQVELAYDPPSLHKGIWLSALSSAALALLLLLLAWRARLGPLAG